MREIPLITMNAATFNDMDKCERYLDKVVDKMSMEERMKVRIFLVFFRIRWIRTGPHPYEKTMSSIV